MNDESINKQTIFKLVMKIIRDENRWLKDENRKKAEIVSTHLKTIKEYADAN